MELMALPMFSVAFVGLKTFLDNHMVVLPLLCITAFVVGFTLLVKWNIERLCGG
jgi:hypothetical protein